ncbi:PKD domain-containing protein [Flammeovirga sp. SubArs3]|uniref:PKD domain-containing protein n=1 Tax=Flammeovirga sp. SubArs3 TaxID=2995316 RepID=UPI00248D2955|nr:PKD domain-containing protein [Flammeovirga sp. SubArs3]
MNFKCNYLILCSIVFSFFAPVHAQFPSDGHTENDPRKVVDVKNASYYGYVGDEEIRDIAIGSDGSIYLIGKTSSDTNIASSGAHQESINGEANTGLSDAFLVKMDEKGTTRLWSTYYGNADADEGNAIALHNDDVYIVGTKSDQAFLAKFSSKGALIWEKTFGTATTSNGIDISITNTQIFVMGHYFGGSTNNAFVTSFDFNGQLIKEQTIEGDVQFLSNMTTDNTNVYITGYLYDDTKFPSSSGQITLSSDGFVAKVNNNNTFEWARNFSTSFKDEPIQIEYNSNQLYVAGQTKKSISIVKIDQFSGNENKTLVDNYGGSKVETVQGLTIDSKGNIFITGITESDNLISSSSNVIYQDKFGGEKDVYVTKFNSNGSVNWATYFGHTATDEGLCIALNSKDAIYTAGMASSHENIATDDAYDRDYNGARDGFFSEFHDLYITKDPKKQKVGYGETAQFTAKAEGSIINNDIEYQWYYKPKGDNSWSKVTTSANANSTTLEILNCDESHAGFYKCVAYSETVGQVVHTYQAELEVITITVSDGNFCLDGTSTLTTVDFSGNPDVTDVTYTWTATPSATAGLPANTNSSSIEVHPTYAGEYTYSVVVDYTENGEVSQLAVSADLTVLPIPHVDATNLKTAFCSNEETNIVLETVFQYDINDDDPNNRQDNNNWKNDPTRVINYTWTVNDNANVIGYENGNINGTTNSTVNAIKQVLINTSKTDQKVTYNIGVSLTDGCPTDPPVDIIVYASPEVDAGEDLTLCEGDEKVLLTGFTPSDGVWSGDGIVQNGNDYYFDPQMTGTGEYTLTLTATDANACTNSDTRKVTINPLPTFTAQAVAPQICSEDNSEITLEAINSPNITYRWIVKDITNVAGATDGEATVTDGLYTIQQKLTNSSYVMGSVTYEITPISDGCEGLPKEVTIEVNPTPTLAPIDAIELCSDIEESISLTGDVANTTFYWEVIENNGNLVVSDGSSTTLWKLKIENKTYQTQVVKYRVYAEYNGCLGDEQEVVVTVQPHVDFTINNQLPEFCSGENASVDVSSDIINAPIYYSWKVTNQSPSFTMSQYDGSIIANDGNSTALFQESIINNTNQDQTVIVEVTSSANNCDGEKHNFSVVVHPTPVAEIITTGSPIEICGDANFLLEANNDHSLSGTTYQWLLDDVEITGAINPTYTATTAGRYTIQVSYKGCTSTSDYFEIIQASDVQAVITPLAKNEFCYDEDINVIISSQNTADDYIWYKDNVEIARGSNEITATEAGVYKLITIDGGGCTSIPDEVTLTILPKPTVIISADESVFCIGDVISTNFTASTSGEAGSFQWLKEDDISKKFVDIPGETNANYNGTEIGNYQLRFTTTEGCIVYSNILSISHHPVVIADAGDDQTVCQESTISIGSTGIANYTYTWKALTANAPNLSDISSANPTVLPTLTTMADTYEYEVTVTDVNTGCQNTDRVEVVVAPLPIVSIDFSNKVVWCGNEDINTELTANISNLSDLVDVEYLWTDEKGTLLGTDETITVTSVGEYQLEVKTNNDCIASTKITVTQYDEQAPVVLIDDVQVEVKEICDGESVVLKVTPYDNNLTYTWVDENDDPVGNGETINVSKAGSYKVNVTIGEGCNETSDAVDIIIKELPVATISTTNATDYCLGEPINVLINANETDMDTYQWYKDGVIINGANDKVLIATAAGSYTLIVTKEGCTSKVTDPIVIKEHNYPTATIAADQLSFCDGQEISALLTAESDIAVAYQWQKEDNSGNFQDITGATSKTYTAKTVGQYKVVVTSINGCQTGSEAKEVKQIDLPSVAITITHGAPVICENDFAELSLPQDPSFIYTWFKDGIEIQGENEYRLVVTTSGNYHAKVEQSTGNGNVSCEAETDVVEITVQPLPTLVITDPGNICQFSSKTMVVTRNPDDISEGDIVLEEWSGTDITTEGIFTPSQGNTTYTLTYKYQFKYNGAISSCEQTASIDVFVDELPQLDLSTVPTNFCNTDSDINLDQYGPFTSSDGLGQWSGKGVSGNIFNPSKAVLENGGAVGIIELTYTFISDTGCESKASIQVNINNPEDVTAGLEQEMCIGDETLVMQGAAPSGGIWSVETAGATIEADGTFKPETSGEFTVVYTVGSGSCRVEDKKVITVHEMPVIDAGNNIEVCLNDPAFDLRAKTSAIYIDGNEEEWSGQGIVDDENIIFDPESVGVGNYEITFTSKNPTTGCTTIDQVWVRVTPLATPDFTLATDAAYCVNTEAVFINNTPDVPGHTVSYRWDFGDGSGSTEKDGYHTFTSVTETIDVTLYAITDKGCETSITKTIQIVESPAALFTMTYDPSGCTPLDVVFDNQSEGYAMNYRWDFGNGIISSDEHPSPITYINEGLNDTTYYVTLTVNNICGTSVFTDSIKVKALPIVDFIVSKDTICADEVAEMYNFTQGIATKYEWNFGDGTPIFTTTEKGLIEHAYTNESSEFITRTISLTAFSDCGSTVMSKNVVVKPKELHALFNVTPQSGCEGTAVNITSNQLLGQNKIVWDMGDGTIIEDSIALQYVYEEAGNYTITMSINNGCHSDNFAQNVDIKTSPEVDFEMIDAICITEGLQVTNTSNSSYTYYWDFGDGETYNGYTPPVKFYSTTGPFTVSLTATDPVIGCSRTISKEVEIYAIPTASFDVPDQICGGEETTLTSTSENVISYLWEFEDGQIFTSASVTTEITYSQNVTLTVTNENNCQDQNTQFVIVTGTPIPEDALPDSLNICISGSEQVCVDPIIGATVYWTKDGNRLTEDNELCVTADEAGDYVLVAIDENTGCTFTDTLKVNKYQLHLPQDGVFCDTDDSNVICPEFDIELPNKSDFSYQWTNRNTGEQVTSECLPTVGMSVGLQSWDLTVVDDKGCTLSGNTEFYIVKELVANVEDKELCDDGEPVYLIAQDLSHYDWATYRWWSISDPSTIIGTDGTLLIEKNGRYVAEITDTRSGCVVLDTARVTVYPTPEFSIIGYDGPLCNSMDTLMVDNTNISGLKVEWSGDSFIGDPNGLSIVVNQAGVYYATVTDLNNPLLCSRTEMINVEVYPVPQLNLKDTTVCSVDLPAELIAEDPEHEPGVQYRWYNIDDPSTVLSTDGIYYAERAGVYAVEAFNENSGCSNFDTARVQVDHTPTFKILGYDAPTCDETVRLYLNKTPSDSVQVIWYKDNIEWVVDQYEVTVYESGAYRVTMTNITKPTQCASEQIINIWLNEKPTVTVNDIETCQDAEDALLRASINIVDEQNRYEYQWYNIYQPDDVLFNGITFPVSETGDYFVHVIDTKSGCLVASDTATAILNALPTFSIGGYDGPICANSTILSIEDRSLEGIRSEWFLEDELIAKNIQSYQTDRSGLYQIILTDTTKETNCTYQQEVQVVLNDFPDLSINGNVDTLQVCKGETFELFYQSDRTVDVEWSTGETTALIQPEATVSQWYSIVATDKNGCQSEASIYVNVQEVVIELPETALICANGDDTEIAVDPGYKTYSWENELGTVVSQSNILSTNITGTYTLYVSNELGCSVEKSITLNGVDDLTLEATNYPTICDDDESATIQVTEGFKYYFWEGSSVSTGPTYEAYELGTYEVVAVTEAGCEYVLQIDVTNCCGPEIDMLESDKGKTIVFTPHSTPGENDLFKLEYKYVDSFEMRIYSRWGNEVFYTTNPEDAWDGKFSGKPAPSDIYQVIINYTGCFEGGVKQEQEVIQLYLAD